MIIQYLRNSLFLGKCCQTVEVFSENYDYEAYKYQTEIYGQYSLTNSKNESVSFYQSAFDEGKYGIWLCGSRWFIGKVKQITCLLSNV